MATEQIEAGWAYDLAVRERRPSEERSRLYAAYRAACERLAAAYERMVAAEIARSQAKAGPPLAPEYPQV